MELNLDSEHADDNEAIITNRKLSSDSPPAASTQHQQLPRFAHSPAQPGLPDEDYQVWADESEYNRSEYGQYVMFLGIALFVWVFIAKQEHDEKVEVKHRVARSVRIDQDRADKLEAAYWLARSAEDRGRNRDHVES